MYIWIKCFRNYNFLSFYAIKQANNKYSQAAESSTHRAQPKIVIPIGQPQRDNNYNQSQINSGAESFVNEFNEPSLLTSQLDAQDQRYLNPNSTFIDQSQYGFKLPQLKRNYESDEFSVKFINPDIVSSRVQEETNRLFNLSDHIDDEINKIIRNYPSIVVRRRGVPGETKKRSRKQMPIYLTENQISYHKASAIEPSVVVSKSRRDLTHTIDYGKLIWALIFVNVLLLFLEILCYHR